jgi:hypothetical protein
MIVLEKNVLKKLQAFKNKKKSYIQFYMLPSFHSVLTSLNEKTTIMTKKFQYTEYLFTFVTGYDPINIYLRSFEILLFFIIENNFPPCFAVLELNDNLQKNLSTLIY